ncbi:(2Fe-2S)-binding protein [Saccharibacillus qingshengii]|uniref:(2Fe-2S)-binding protein n=1 Tax=Saccharibacillus qingshengii TaxID=1763540 RepID=UPI001551AE84|nr:(2Fe-2S)-binding protein [Saccharibacillus qingshengii]
MDKSEQPEKLKLPESEPLEERQSETLEAFLRDRFAMVRKRPGKDAEFEEEDVQNFPYSVQDLLDPDVLRLLLLRQSVLLGRAAPDVTGTLFAKRYSVLAAGLFAAYSAYGAVLSPKPGDIRLRIGAGAAMGYRVREEPRLTGGYPSLSAYAGKVEAQVQTVLSAVQRASGANASVLHTLVLHQIHTLYLCLEAELQQGGSPFAARADTIRRHRQELSAPANSWFHARFRSIGPDAAGRPLLLRRHCCQAYRTVQSGRSHGYCDSCPKSEAYKRT